jgi:hypothetical protein
MQVYTLSYSLKYATKFELNARYLNKRREQILIFFYF